MSYYLQDPEQTKSMHALLCRWRAIRWILPVNAKVAVVDKVCSFVVEAGAFSPVVCHAPAY